MFQSNFVTKPRTNQLHPPSKFNTFNQFDGSTSERDGPSFHNTRAGTTSSETNQVFNMVGQSRKTPSTNHNQMMMTGQYFNNTQSSGSKGVDHLMRGAAGNSKIMA